MLKACGETFSITKMPDFTVYKTRRPRARLDQSEISLLPGRRARKTSDRPGAPRPSVPLRHR